MIRNLHINFKAIITFFVVFFISLQGFSQLVVSQDTPENLVNNVLLGSGVTVSNITSQGGPVQFGSFTANGTNLGLSSGVVMCTGNISVAVGPNTSGAFSVTSGVTLPGDADLSIASGATLANIRDKAILEFDFIPLGDTVTFRYVFGSDEYNEYVCSNFNDVFGFFLSGPGINGPYSGNAANIALVPNSTLPVAINTVNIGQPGSSGSPGGCPTGGLSNSQFFIDNPVGSQFVQFDGFTTVLTAKSAVQCGQTYHIKIAIADVFDGAFDSGVFLEANSFTSDFVQVDVTNVLADSSIIEGCSQAEIVLLRGNSSEEQTIFYEVGGNAIPGIDYIALPGSITFPAGVNTVSINVVALEDGIFEPNRDTIIIRVFNITACGDTIISEGIIYIKENYIIEVATTDVVINCPSNNIQLTAVASGGLAPYNYTWNTEPPQFTPTATVAAVSDTFFVVTVKDVCGVVEGIDTVRIIYNGPPPLQVVASNDLILEGCPGQIAPLSVLIFDGLPPYTISWSNGITTQDNTIIVNSDTLVYIDVTDGCGFPTVSDTVKIKLNYQYPQAALIDTTVSCLGDIIQLNAIYTGGTAPITYEWPTEASSLNNVSVTVNGDTLVPFIITDACNVSSAGAYAVDLPIYPPIVIELFPDTVTLCKGGPLSLLASVTGGNQPLTYVWQLPSGGVIANDTIATFELQEGGNYIFTATDQCGDALSDTTIVNAQNCVVKVANIVTKDGDEANSSWKIQNLEFYTNNQVLIYNRWGNKIFEAAPYQNNFEFKNQPSGTYFFVLNLNDGTKPITGTITVLEK